MMKTACATILVLAAFGGSAMAATPLDGAFNGSYSCPNYQGVTNLLLNFTVTGNRAKLIEVLYDSASSKYRFGSSVIEYSGLYNATKRTFAVNTLKPVGQEPSGWSYPKSLAGSVSADGGQVTIPRNPATNACGEIVVARISATSILKQ
jgi:hypothetical protein